MSTSRRASNAPGSSIAVGSMTMNVSPRSDGALVGGEQRDARWGRTQRTAQDAGQQVHDERQAVALVAAGLLGRRPAAGASRQGGVRGGGRMCRPRRWPSPTGSDQPRREPRPRSGRAARSMSPCPGRTLRSGRRAPRQRSGSCPASGPGCGSAPRAASCSSCSPRSCPPAPRAARTSRRCRSGWSGAAPTVQVPAARARSMARSMATRHA